MCGEVPLEILKSCTLSWSKIFGAIALSLTFFQSNFALSLKFLGKLSENVEMFPSKLFSSHSQSANGLQRRSGVNNENMYPAEYKEMMPCPGVGILKIISGTPPYGKIHKYHPRVIGKLSAQ